MYEMELNDSFGYEHFVNEFQNWFETSGLKDDLKTHIRTKIVDFLKSTNLDNVINEPNTAVNSTISPKMQAINYLIAEYLLKQKFGYTFSVFSSELTAFDKNFFTNFLKNDNKLNKQELVDIIETLSIMESKKLIDEYFKKDEPFLVSYFRNLSIKKSDECNKKFDEELDCILKPLDKKNKFFNEFKMQLVELFESMFVKKSMEPLEEYASLKEAYGNLILENDNLKKQIKQLELNKPMGNDFSAQVDLPNIPPRVQFTNHGKSTMSNKGNSSVQTSATSSSSSDDKFSANIRKKLKTIHQKYDNIFKKTRSVQMVAVEDEDCSSLVQPLDSLTLSSDILNSNKTDN